MPKPSARTVFGLAVETTKGTAKVPTVFIPVSTVTPKDAVTQLEDKGWRGAMVDTYDAQAGMIVGSFDYDGDVFLDLIGYQLGAMLGDVTETGAGPYIHTFAVINSSDGQPKSHTLTDFYVAGTRAYASAMYSELDFKFSPDALLTYSAKAMSFGSATAAAPTPSYTDTEEALPGWGGTVKIGGSTFADMTDAEISIKRTATAIKPIGNSQVPSQIFVGTINVSGKATLVMEDDTYLTDYLNGTKTSLEFDFTQGADSIKFHMSKVNLSAADIQRGKDYIELPITFKAHGNSTDIGTSAGYGPLVVTLTNTIASGLY